MNGYLGAGSSLRASCACVCGLIRSLLHLCEIDLCLDLLYFGLHRCELALPLLLPEGIEPVAPMWPRLELAVGRIGTQQLARCVRPRCSAWGRSAVLLSTAQLGARAQRHDAMRPQELVLLVAGTQPRSRPARLQHSPLLLAGHACEEGRPLSTQSKK